MVSQKELNEPGNIMEIATKLIYVIILWLSIHTIVGVYRDMSNDIEYEQTKKLLKNKMRLEEIQRKP